MAWVILLFAGLLEIVFAYSLKQSEGFTRLTPSLITLVTMGASFWMLSIAMRTLPMGTAYIIWTGIGAVGSFLVGVYFLSEPLTMMRSFAAILIVSGLVLMKISS